MGYEYALCGRRPRNSFVGGFDPEARDRHPLSVSTSGQGSILSSQVQDVHLQEPWLSVVASTFPETSLLILLANVCLWWKFPLGARVTTGIRSLRAHGWPVAGLLFRLPPPQSSWSLPLSLSSYSTSLSRGLTSQSSMLR